MSSRSKQKSARRHDDVGAHSPPYALRSGTQLGILLGGTRFMSRSTNEPSFSLDLLDLDRDINADPERIVVDFLPHGISVHPRRPHEAALFEKQGPGACYVDLVERRVLHRIVPIEGHSFYGHGAFSRDGDALFAVETDLATNDGAISVRDASTFAPRGTFPTFGKAPHDCQLIEDGKTLAITNGGGPTGTADLPCVTFVDVASHKLLERHEVKNPAINTGHIAFTRRFREFAVVSAPRAGLPGATSLGGLSLRVRNKPWSQVVEPREITSRFVGESLSVCVHEPTRMVAATHPFGHLVTFWNFDTGRLIAILELPNPRGVTLTLDESCFAVSYGEDARLKLLRADPLGEIGSDGPAPGIMRFGGSHTYAWGHPAS